ncbi:MAG: nucleotidyltransferase domain-containing protein [Deltaproteobacteria bacterium]|nr:nucleotidyltransferase domain-containing protein [Deltaproteobacteria bacterium]
MSTPRADRAIRHFLERLSAIDAGRVERVVLFGSRARGDFRGDSDVDLLVIVDRRDEPLLDSLYDAAFAALLEEGLLLSLKVVPREVYAAMLAQEEPFAEAVEREGVVLWTKPSENAYAAT